MVWVLRNAANNAVWVAFLLALVQFVALPDKALGQSVNATTLGVRHVLSSSLRLGPNSPFANQQQSKLKTALHVYVRVSDHAPDSDFFGVVAAAFSSLEPDQSGPVQIMWQDDKCHRNRGLPKVTIIRMEGVIFEGETRHQVFAIPRHLGQLMPADEILVTKKPVPSGDSQNVELAMQAQTKTTQLLLDLHLSALRCNL